MPYDHDMGREIRRLIPLGVSSFAVDALVTVTLVAVGHTPWKFAGPTFAAIWLLILPAQMAAIFLLQLLLQIMHDYDFPVSGRLPVLLGASAAGGAAAFCYFSLWAGAVCGLMTLTGWLVSIRDRLE